MTHRQERRGRQLLLVGLVTATVAATAAAAGAVGELQESKREVAAGQATQASITCKMNTAIPNDPDPKLEVSYKLGAGLAQQDTITLLCPLPLGQRTWILEGVPAPISLTGEALPALKDVLVTQKITRVGANLVLTATAGEATRRDPDLYYRNVAATTYSLTYKQSQQERLRDEVRKAEEERKRATPKATPSGEVPTPSAPQTIPGPPPLTPTK